MNIGLLRAEIKQKINMELKLDNAWVYDYEVFPNLFTAVFRRLGVAKKEYLKFVIHESQNDIVQLLEFLGTRPTLVGYNNLDFDGQFTEYIWRDLNVNTTAELLYEFMQTLPIITKERFAVRYSEWDKVFKEIDLATVNHYTGFGEEVNMTSLKWLAFTMRSAKLKDLPVPIDAHVPKSKISSVVSYNTKDVDVTYEFFQVCIPMLELRKDLAIRFKQSRIMNMADASFGAYIPEHILTKNYGYNKKKLKKGTYLGTVYGRDIVLPYVNFQTEAFKNVHKTFLDRVYEDVDEKGIKGEAYRQDALFQDMVFVYGSGGLHACWKAGEFYEGWYDSDWKLHYRHDDKSHGYSEDELKAMGLVYCLIESRDVTSYYPNLGIQNSFYPKHIGPEFCTIYDRDMFQERLKYAKGTSMNYGLKIGLNSVYGKSNSKYSIYYDPSYTLEITVNGQLLLSMLSESLANVGKLLMVNTDGIEIIVPRDRVQEMNDICDQWELLTSLQLESVEYKQLIIKDVNNYIAVTKDGKVKRKGLFEIYEDYIGLNGAPHQLHKDASATVIPTAMFNYYVNDIPIADTITNENNIYEFCYGIKGQKNFEYWLITSNEGVIDIDKHDERVFRYYISPTGANIYKFWKDGRKNNIQAVSKGQLVTDAMDIKSQDIVKTTKTGSSIEHNINYDWYISEAQKWIDHVSNETRDNAYIDYFKKLEKENESAN